MTRFRLRLAFLAALVFVVGLYAWSVSTYVTPLAWWLVFPSTIAALGVAVGARGRLGRDRLAWWSIAASCVLTAVASAASVLFERFSVPHSGAIVGVLRAPENGLIAFGLMAMIAARTPMRDRFLVIETAIVGMSMGLLLWVFLVEPTLAGTTMWPVERSLSVVQPLACSILVALAARLFLGYRVRTRSFVLLHVAITARVVASLMEYMSQLIPGRYSPFAASVCMAGAFGLFAIAALDRRDVDEPIVANDPVRLSGARLWIVVVASLAPQMVLIMLLGGVVGADRANVVGACAVCAAITALTLVRLWGLAHNVRSLTERRSRERLASLVERSADVVMLVDDKGRIGYSNPAMTTVLGYNQLYWEGDPLLRLPVVSRNDSWPALVHKINALGVEKELDAEVTVLHANTHPRLMELNAINLSRHGSVGGVVLTLRDITDHRALQQRLTYRADHDELTGLANRASFLTQLNESLAAGTSALVMFIDLDDFKVINDTLGHDAGDGLLIEVASRLRRCIPAEAVIARMGGDEFAALLHSSTIDAARTIGAAIVAELREPVELGDYRTTGSSCSIGIAKASGDDRASEVMRNADQAMYRAKRLGKGLVEAFDAELEREVDRADEYRRDLVRALSDDQFELVFQPIVRLGDGTVIGAEALLRWEHPAYGLVMPGDFVEIAEQSGAIIPIGWWAIERACHVAAGWDDDSMFVTVNMSGGQLRDGSLVAKVADSLRASGLRPDRLVLEITESMLIDDLETACSRLEQIRALGVRTALDDFGTGYSSLSYLHRLPLDILKIDREFVNSLDDVRDRALIRSVVSMAAHLGLQSLAEGVETEAQALELENTGCLFAQGYLFSRPLTPAGIAAFVDQQRQVALIAARLRLDSLAMPAPVALAMSAPLTMASSPALPPPLVLPPV